MRKLFATAVMMSVLAIAAWAQDSEDETETPAPAAEADTGSADEQTAGDDQGSYADAEDDDFRPSEEIPADQSIPFPTDI